jgi:RNA polymerase sigma factor (sigma-70 family)
MGKLAHLSEDIIQRCLRKDQAAWEQLYSWLSVLFLRYGPGAFSLTREEAQEAFQSTLLELFQNDCRVLRSFAWRSRPETYLVSVARNMAADVRAKRLPETGAGELIPPTGGEADFQRSDFWLVAERHLSKADVDLLRLVAAGLSQAEIAASLREAKGKPVSSEAVAVKKHRALRRLRKALQSDNNPL